MAIEWENIFFFLVASKYFIQILNYRTTRRTEKKSFVNWMYNKWNNYSDNLTFVINKRDRKEEEKIFVGFDSINSYFIISVLWKLIK